ncbi:MAG: restriction endonuclease subunit S [Acidimicrobiales bacterium]
MLLALSTEHGVVPRAADGGRQLPSAETVEGYWLVEPNDFVFNPMWAVGGGVAVSSIAGAVSTAYRVYSLSERVHPRFLHYYMRSAPIVEQYSLVVRGLTTFDRSVTRDDLESLPVPIPPLSEQRAIANFLDTETARIDALISKKRRLVGLLDERRIGLLTDEVSGGATAAQTAGIDDWFPSLPAGWRLSTVGAVTNAIMDGPHVSPEYVDPDAGGVPFISVRNIFVDRWDLSTAKYINRMDFSSFCRRVKPEVGDVLLTKGGNTGIAREVDFDFDFHVWVHVAILKPRRDVMLPAFLTAVLNSRPGYEQSQLGTRGATNQDLALGRIAKIRVPLPPLDQQQQIVSAISTGAGPLAVAAQRLNEQIDLLVEHRQALITATVTGQLPVGVAA